MQKKTKQNKKKNKTKNKQQTSKIALFMEEW